MGQPAVYLGGKRLTKVVETGACMSVGAIKELQPQIRQGLPGEFRKGGCVYAIAFDMDIEQLRTNYGDPDYNAYLEVRRVLQRHGFTWQQGSVYFGGESVTAVTGVLAAIDLAQSRPWLAASV